MVFFRIKCLRMLAMTLMKGSFQYCTIFNKRTKSNWHYLKLRLISKSQKVEDYKSSSILRTFMYKPSYCKNSIRRKNFAPWVTSLFSVIVVILRIFTWSNCQELCSPLKTVWWSHWTKPETWYHCLKFHSDCLC